MSHRVGVRHFRALGMASVLLGCSASRGIHGSVSLREVAGAAGGPAAGARVTLTCPGRPAPIFTTVSDSSGRFAHDLAGSVSNACTLIIEGPGLFPRSVRVLDACARSDRDDRCNLAVVTAHLQRQPAP